MKRYELPKALTLDVSKWICGVSEDACGEDPEVGLGCGRGRTRLKNVEGFMCCLGQFALQAGVPECDLIGVGAPWQLRDEHQILVDGLALDKGRDSEGTNETELALGAMRINDDEATTVEQKVGQLKALCTARGYTLTVTNLDKVQLKPLPVESDATAS